MPPEITKEICKSFGNFNGDCEFCLDAWECSKVAFSKKETQRTPDKDWLEE
jgi:hypothetical protein